MTGINLTPQRRSELLQRLLEAQSRPQANPQTGLEAALRLGADALTQRQIKTLAEQEKASQNTTRSNENAAIAKMLGGGDQDFQGRPIVDALGNQQNAISPEQAIGQLPVGNPLRSAFQGQALAQQFAQPDTSPPKTREVKRGGEIVTEQWNPQTRQFEEIGRSPRTSPSTTVNVNNQLPGEKNTPKVTSDLQTTISQSQDQLALLEPLVDQFDEGFLNLKGDIKAAVLETGNYLGAPINQAQAAFLTDRATFMATAAEGLNTYINQLSGAAVSPDEATRLLKGFPDAENDSPIVFFAKLKSKVQQSKIATARAKLALELGVVGVDKISGISSLNSDSFKKSLNRAADQWFQQAKDEGMTEDEARQFVQKRTRNVISIGGSVLEL